MFKIKTKTSWSKTNIKTKTFIFVLEAPRDQDPGLEDYITAPWQAENFRLYLTTTSAQCLHLSERVFFLNFDRNCWSWSFPTAVSKGNLTFLCIVCCQQSRGAIISQTIVTHMNFRICGHQTAVISILLITKSWATSLPIKIAEYEWFEAASDCWEFNWNRALITGDNINHWRRRLLARIRATGGHFEYSLWYNLVTSLIRCNNLS